MFPEKDNKLRIITYRRIKQFSKIHANATTPLNFWYHTTRSKNWSSFNEVKKDFPSADYIGNYRFVFNIGGNNYRLIAIISFNAKKVYIRFIGTHDEYNKIKNLKNI